MRLLTGLFLSVMWVLSAEICITVSLTVWWGGVGCVALAWGFYRISCMWGLMYEMTVMWFSPKLKYLPGSHILTWEGTAWFLLSALGSVDHICFITWSGEIIRTRSSADADNWRDAFSGQLRSTNMVPFWVHCDFSLSMWLSPCVTRV